MIKKRLISILLAAIMLLILMPVTALAVGAEQSDTAWYTGHESDASYTLTTAAQLAGLAQLCNADYAASPFAGKTVNLGANIDLTGYNWQPIWWNAGTFDGQGFAITGLNVTEGVSGYVALTGIYGGLFASANNGAKLCNFTVSGSVELNYEGNLIVLYAGGVVGYNANCTIINVGSNVDVETISSIDCYSGGIAGYTWQSSGSANCILNSYANGEISAQSADNRNHNAGGIAGTSEDSPIVNCYYGGTSVTGKKTAGITYNANDNNVANCYSNFTGSTQFGSIIDGIRYDDAADLLAKLNDATVRQQIITDRGVMPLRWKMGTGGMPVLAFQPDEQFTLTPGGTYWFDLSGETIPGTVNAALPDSTLHYVPFTYAGTVDAYVLKEASSDVEGSSEQAAIAADPNAQYGYRYDHSLFISDYNVTHTVSRRELVEQSLIFGKAYASGGVSYTLRAPSEGSKATFVEGEVTNVTPQSNEWDTVLRKNIEIKNFQDIYSRGQDTQNSSFFVSRGSRSARHFSATTIDVKWPSNGFRPVLEVLGGLASNSLKAVALDLNGGSVGGNGTISIIVNNGADFTAPSAAWLTRPAGDSGAYFQWKDGSGKLYTPGAAVPATVTALTAVWTPDAANAAALIPVGELASTLNTPLYNSERTVWLTGGGLSYGGQLITERDPAGAEYDELRRLANGAEVFNVYNIYLRDGRKSTGSAMYLTFDLNAKYAGEAFTLVHQKADGTREYFYTTADANGDLKFGPLGELSPFMLVRGTLAQVGVTVPSADVRPPQTGDGDTPAFWAGTGMLCALGLAAAVYAIRRKRITSAS